ncbi:SRPBCC family protein [Microbacterium sp.]|uniref:SRPBCC family protein n=1 Tax=Microbacterium sp. TaxID=51671 RepID=UPI002D7680E1|nr:SRPBCC family protein [Microbacterium sp.]HET6301908.1 SRPBCC family protein [Microbacterium sp.]
MRQRVRRAGIYVETVIRADVDEVWRRTQDPAAHVRWDIRFSSIEPTGETDAGATRFRYTRRTPFHIVEGTGVSLGEIERPDGTRTSALRFATDDVLSPIRSGRGYWRYVPTDGGTAFITGYDYEPGWGVLDVLVRPLLGLATAWSFDRLRVWIETGVPPERWPLWSVVWWWHPDRPRARRCRRRPVSRPRRADHLVDAPATLAQLPDPSPEAVP